MDPKTDLEKQKSADSEQEDEESVENPDRLRPFEGPSGTPGRVGDERIIHPVHPSSDPYPGVHVK